MANPRLQHLCGLDAAERLSAAGRRVPLFRPRLFAGRAVGELADPLRRRKNGEAGRPQFLNLHLNPSNLTLARCAAYSPPPPPGLHDQPRRNRWTGPVAAPSRPAAPSLHVVSGVHPQENVRTGTWASREIS